MHTIYEYDTHKHNNHPRVGRSARDVFCIDGRARHSSAKRVQVVRCCSLRAISVKSPNTHTHESPHTCIHSHAHSFAAYPLCARSPPPCARAFARACSTCRRRMQRRRYTIKYANVGRSVDPQVAPQVNTHANTRTVGKRSDARTSARSNTYNRCAAQASERVCFCLLCFCLCTTNYSDSARARARVWNWPSE